MKKKLEYKVHEVCCKNCPAAQGTDPEAEEILKWPIREKAKMIFPCAWRPYRFCKGNYDKIIEL